MKAPIVLTVLALAVVGCHRPTPEALHPERPECTVEVAQACKSSSGDCFDGIGIACAQCSPAPAFTDGCFASVQPGPSSPPSTILLSDQLYWVCYADCSSCAPTKPGESCAPQSSP